MCVRVAAVRVRARRSRWGRRTRREPPRIRPPSHQNAPGPRFSRGWPCPRPGRAGGRPAGHACGPLRDGESVRVRVGRRAGRTREEKKKWSAGGRPCLPPFLSFFLSFCPCSPVTEARRPPRARPAPECWPRTTHGTTAWAASRARTVPATGARGGKKGRGGRSFLIFNHLGFISRQKTPFDILSGILV